MGRTKAAAVGSRVRVYWEGEGEWFEGVVREYNAENGYYIEYDDGEEQWEAENADFIEVLSSPTVDAQLIIDAESAAEGEDNEYEQEEEHVASTQPHVATKWSAEPPPSTQLSSPTAYDDDEYEPDEDHDEVHGKEGTKKTNVSPQPQKDSPVRRSTTEEAKRQPRDPAKYVKSGVFFRDSESLRDTKTALQKEKQELTRQHDLLMVKLQEKELLSRSLKRELHGLKAVVSVGSLTSSLSSSKSRTKPKSTRDWIERVAEQKAASRKIRQEMGERQSQLHETNSKIKQLETTLDQLKTRLNRVPKKDLSTLVEIQMEIAQSVNEKRTLEAELAKSKSVPIAKESRVISTRPGDMRDEKALLEKELRQLDKALARANDEADEWRLSFDKENARIGPLQSRIEALQQELRRYESSQVLLRSMFLRMDRQGTGSITRDAAVNALVLLAPGADQQNAIPAAVGGDSLTFAQFTECFNRVFPPT